MKRVPSPGATWDRRPATNAGVTPGLGESLGLEGRREGHQKTGTVVEAMGAGGPREVAHVREGCTTSRRFRTASGSSNCGGCTEEPLAPGPNSPARSPRLGSPCSSSPPPQRAASTQNQAAPGPAGQMPLSFRPAQPSLAGSSSLPEPGSVWWGAE